MWRKRRLKITDLENNPKKISSPDDIVTTVIPVWCWQAPLERFLQIKNTSSTNSAILFCLHSFHLSVTTETTTTKMCLMCNMKHVSSDVKNTTAPFCFNCLYTTAISRPTSQFSWSVQLLYLLLHPHLTLWDLKFSLLFWKLNIAKYVT